MIIAFNPVDNLLTVNYCLVRVREDFRREARGEIYTGAFKEQTRSI